MKPSIIEIRVHVIHTLFFCLFPLSFTEENFNYTEPSAHFLINSNNISYQTISSDNHHKVDVI